MRRRIAARLFGAEVESISIGRFRVLETLGEGGMGVVYAAEDAQLGRQVALKVIRDEVSRRDARERERLLREARALARLSHPNVVQVHEVGEHEGDVFIVMELVRGSTLRRWLELGERPLSDVLARFIEAAQGLDAAHRVGIVHRDFKPTNALVGEDGRVRIVDFGLARGDPRDVDVTPDLRRGSAVDAAPTTETRAGTPAYMSPEQAIGASCDARSDQFSFCVALFEAVYGRRPFTPEELVDRARQPDAGASPVPDGGAAPGWLRRLLARGLATRPEDRFPSMAALIDAWQRAARRRRQWSLGLAIAASLLAAAAAGVALQGTPQERCPDPRERLADIWGAPQRAALDRAFAATALDQAPVLAARTRHALDDYVDRWVAVRRDACEATWIRGEMSALALDHSTRCLDDARRELAHLTTALAGGAPVVVAESEALVAALPDPTRCRDRPLDARPTAVRDPELAARLDRARLLERTLQGRPAEAALLLALERSAELGDLDGEAEALLLLGRTRARLLRQPHPAIASLHRAIDLATRVGRAELVSAGWSELAWVTGYELEDAESGRRWLAHARSSAGEPLERAVEVELLAVEGQLLETEGRTAEAVRLRQSVIARLLESHPPDHPDVLRARGALAVSLGLDGAGHEALSLHEALWHELGERLGFDHPWTARVELDLGLDALALERHPEAREHLEHAHRTLAGTYGVGNPRVATAGLILAQLDLGDGAVDSGIARANRALAVYTESFPRGHGDRVSALALLSDLYLAKGSRAPQLEVSRELLAIHDSGAPSAADIDLPGVLTNIGECLCELGRCEESLPFFGRLMALYAQSPPDEGALRAFPFHGVGRVHLVRGEPALAVPFLEEAVTIFATHPRERAGMTDAYVDALRRLADALQALGRTPDRVRALRRRARDVEAEAIAAPTEASQDDEARPRAPDLSRETPRPAGRR